MNLHESWARLTEQRPALLAADPELDLAENLADLIVRARVQAGLSQTEFAELAGTTQSRVSELERGTANPTLDSLTRVLNVVQQLLASSGAAKAAPATTATFSVVDPGAAEAVACEQTAIAALKGVAFGYVPVGGATHVVGTTETLVRAEGVQLAAVANSELALAA